MHKVSRTSYAEQVATYVKKSFEIEDVRFLLVDKRIATMGLSSSEEELSADELQVVSSKLDSLKRSAESVSYNLNSIRGRMKNMVNVAAMTR
jgi:hypothetical protein